MSMANHGHYLVLGAGGLGCPALLGLISAGAGGITIVDHDVVDISNLHRQVLYDHGDVGATKVAAAAFQIRRRAPQIQVTTHHLRLGPETLPGLLAAQPAGTIVLECSDAPSLKFLVNDLCVASRIPVVIGGVVRWHGQVQSIVSGAACLRCVFEGPPPLELQEPCAAVGVMGTAAGVLGQWMATVAVGLDREGARTGGLWHFDLQRTVVRSLQPNPRKDCPACNTKPMLLADLTPSPSAPGSGP